MFDSSEWVWIGQCVAAAAQIIRGSLTPTQWLNSDSGPSELNWIADWPVSLCNSEKASGGKTKQMQVDKHKICVHGVTAGSLESTHTHTHQHPIGSHIQQEAESPGITVMLSVLLLCSLLHHDDDDDDDSHIRTFSHWPPHHSFHLLVSQSSSVFSFQTSVKQPGVLLLESSRLSPLFSTSNGGGGLHSGFLLCRPS